MKVIPVRLMTNTDEYQLCPNLPVPIGVERMDKTLHFYSLERLPEE